MLLRKGDGWRPVYEALTLDWVDRGTGTEEAYSTRPEAVVAKLKMRRDARQAQDGRP
ncbi:MAG: hypothetical protein JSS18_05670 [Proteobacteria bacterium]|nr:hypothetical protein [Pseudomonadota bacterium]